MEFELHIKGTIEEISQITTLIQKKVERESDIFGCLKTSVTKPPINFDHGVPPSPKRRRWPWSKPVDILMGSIESWFALYKSYNSIQAAAESLWLKEAANIYFYLKHDKVYKEIYKFRYRS